VFRLAVTANLLITREMIYELIIFSRDNYFKGAEFFIWKRNGSSYPPTLKRGISDSSTSPGVEFSCSTGIMQVTWVKTPFMLRDIPIDL